MATSATLARRRSTPAFVLAHVSGAGVGGLAACVPRAAVVEVLVHGALASGPGCKQSRADRDRSALAASISTFASRRRKPVVAVIRRVWPLLPFRSRSRKGTRRQSWLTSVARRSRSWRRSATALASWRSPRCVSRRYRTLASAVETSRRRRPASSTRRTSWVVLLWATPSTEVSSDTVARCASSSIALMASQQLVALRGQSVSL